MKTVLNIIVVLLVLVCCQPPAAALTADEVGALKKKGVSDRTIELMIQSEMERQRQADSSIKISEDSSGTTYATGKPSSTPLSREEQLNVERAWEMLQNLNLEIEKK
jgi:hypothetical protein